MVLHFYKYQGTGNDFILFDNRDGKHPNLTAQQYNKLCDRKFGIGADGVMLLEHVEGYDFRMVYFNSDGSESTMCGNGGRCIVRFAESLGLVVGSANFLAVDGPHYAKISDSEIALQMIDLNSFKESAGSFELNTGSPHIVQWVQNLAEYDVVEKGKSIRYSEAYMPKGINVNFVEDGSEGLQVRTYERGVEDETLSCGTGVTAVAIANALKNNIFGTHNQTIITPGGTLNVRYNRTNEGFKEVFLIGPATFVFEGNVSI
jgi:diaminopimelate epimerase